MDEPEYDDEYDDEEDDDDDDYYGENNDDELEPAADKEKDPEYFEYECYTLEQAKDVLDGEKDRAAKILKVAPPVARVLLMAHNWMFSEIENRNQQDILNLLKDCKVIPRADQSVPKDIAVPSNYTCPVCVQRVPSGSLQTLTCGHFFCKACWTMHLEFQVQDGVATDIQCMASDCSIIATEDFVLPHLNKPKFKDKYMIFCMRDYIKTHYNLRQCPGVDCEVTVKSNSPQPKKVVCTKCQTSWCFQCTGNYHAPADCDTIKRWLTKCADDSETANYISAHTKDCPKCNICIEKNGGCNHMQCSKCKHDFCWMCLGDWKNHGSEYYECSRYKENPNISNECANVKAREALKKYLFYFERWENHSKSLKLEEQMLDGINEKIHGKVMSNTGTWIDWHYLLDSAALLTKCRYTLQYTYPYAYYLDSGPMKDLFEYQQAQLEAEIENLAWKVERVETTDRGDLENQMDVAEKRRLTLLQRFFL
ncbi:potential E3 ubiquitin-protein ligase ariadne-2-like [Antedon mediterranea]|uniref:potential E3 ubiquitin-protein ligase ariadne-2-like n=1 Tax=Antedon mediterranea TaxID=105859 RepID=UPI003AF73103